MVKQIGIFSRLARMRLINFMVGRVVAGAISSWLLATYVRVRCKAGTYGIYGETLCYSLRMQERLTNNRRGLLHCSLRTGTRRLGLCSVA